MSLSLYMDHHVPAPVTAGLRLRGVDCLTAEADGTATLADEQLLQRASDLGRVLFSQDLDLLEIAAAWQEAGRDFAGLVYARQLGITIGNAVRDLELVAKVFDPPEMRGRVLRIPL